MEVRKSGFALHHWIWGRRHWSLSNTDRRHLWSANSYYAQSSVGDKRAFNLQVWSSSSHTCIPNIRLVLKSAQSVLIRIQVLLVGHVEQHLHVHKVTVASSLFKAGSRSNSTCCVTTRHAIYRPGILAQKSRDVLCRACRTTRRDTLVTTSATR